MLEIRNLQKHYPSFTFGPVDITVQEEILTILGPSGSGKTTLLSLIGGIRQPDAGSIALNGRILDGQTIKERQLGLVFQDGALFPHMTARENIGYATTDHKRVEDLAEVFEIADVLDRRPPTLSGGEQQRVALARTLAADPDALLLDEPLSSLDAPIRRRLREELHTLFDGLSIPIIHVTHDQRTAAALGDRIAVFYDGTIEQCGSPETVLNRPQTEFVAQFTGIENRLSVPVHDRTADTTVIELGNTTISVPVSTTAASVTACIHPSRLSIVPPGTQSADKVVVRGELKKWLNTGDEYRVIVSPEQSSTRLVVTVQPSQFETLDPDYGMAVGIQVHPTDVHLLT